eukprot:563-Heterococcus_DN1.PRE.1
MSRTASCCYRHCRAVLRLSFAKCNFADLLLAASARSRDCAEFCESTEDLHTGILSSLPHIRSRLFTAFQPSPLHHPSRCLCRCKGHAARAKVSTQAAKRAVADSLNPLTHTGILQLVCDLVGPGEFIFLALVNKLFRACSLKVPQFDGVDLVQD